jgi:hypothetical protein
LKLSTAVLGRVCLVVRRMVSAPRKTLAPSTNRSAPRRLVVRLATRKPMAASGVEQAANRRAWREVSALVEQYPRGGWR